MVNFEKIPFVESIAKSCSALLKNPWMAAFSCVIDAAFLFLYGFVSTFLLQIAAEMGSVVIRQLPTIIQQQRVPKPILALIFDESVRSITFRVIGIGILFALITYVLYVLFQGTAWKIAQELSGKEKKYLDYIKSFAKINILWFALFAILHTAYAFLSARNAILSKIAGTTIVSFPHILILMALVVVSYFAVVSYPLLRVVKKGFLTIFPGILFLTVLYLALSFFLALIAKLSLVAGSIAGIIVMLVFLVYARVYITILVQKAHVGA